MVFLTNQRSFIIALLLLLAGAKGLFAQQYNVTIEGQIIGYDGVSELAYYFSPENHHRHRLKVQPDSNGHFVIRKNIDRTHFFWFYYQNEGERDIYHRCALIVHPGMNYIFVSPGAQHGDWKNYYTPDIYSWSAQAGDLPKSVNLDKGQMKFNLLDNGYMGSLFHHKWSLREPDNLLVELQERIDSQISKYEELLRENKISRDFFEIARANTIYYKAYELAQTIQDYWMFPQQFFRNLDLDESQVKELKRVHAEIFNLYPLGGEGFEFINLPGRYIDAYLYAYEAQKGDAFNPPARGGSWLDYYDEIEHMLPERVAQDYQLQRVMSQTYALQLQGLERATSFLSENPHMEETEGGQFLRNILIPGAALYDSLARRDLPDGIYFLDETEPVNSFQQLLEMVGNKPFLIDFWGSWCLPCRYQFQHNTKLKPFLEKHGIEMVYIAREYRPDRENWKGMITAFELTGYHFLLTDDFLEDMRKAGVELTKFPTYMIVNENGQILEPDAHLPSDGEKLYRQLEVKLNLIPID